MNKMCLVGNIVEHHDGIEVIDADGIYYIAALGIQRVYGPYKYVEKCGNLDVYTCSSLGKDSCKYDLISIYGEVLYRAMGLDDLFSWVIANISNLILTYYDIHFEGLADKLYNVGMIWIDKQVQYDIDTTNSKYTLVRFKDSNSWRQGIFDYGRMGWLIQPNCNEYILTKYKFIIETTKHTSIIYRLEDKMLHRLWDCGKAIVTMNVVSDRLMRAGVTLIYILTTGAIMNLSSLIEQHVNYRPNIVTWSEIYSLNISGWFIIEHVIYGRGEIVLINTTNDEIYILGCIGNMALKIEEVGMGYKDGYNTIVCRQLLEKGFKRSLSGKTVVEIQA